jgi:type IV pilus assembly protein PilC
MQFLARVGTPEGRVIEESHTAADAGALRKELEKRGLHVFDLRPKGVSRGLSLAGGSSSRRIDMQKFLAFNQELAVLIKAGLPLLQALDLVVTRMQAGTFHTVLADVRDRVRTGEDLSDAFAAHGRLFPRLYPSILKAGERSGELEQVLRRDIRYQKLVLDARPRLTDWLAGWTRMWRITPSGRILTVSRTLPVAPAKPSMANRYSVPRTALNRTVLV